jgi:integrase
MVARYGVQERALPNNPFASVRVRKADKPVKALSEVEVRRLLEAMAGHWLDGPVRLALHTGLRVAEVAALEWADVDLDHALLTVRRARAEGQRVKAPKNRKARAVPLNQETVAVLRALKAKPWPGVRVFPWHHDSISHAFNDVQRRMAGEDPYKPRAKGAPELPTFHWLRHTHASWLLRDNVPLYEVSQRLGHSSVAVTATMYAHYIPGRGHEVAERFATAVAQVLHTGPQADAI